MQHFTGDQVKNETILEYAVGLPHLSQNNNGASFNQVSN